MMTGKKILVVGALSGIGAQLVPLLLQEGAVVLATSRSRDKFLDHNWSDNPGVTLLPLDFKDSKSVADLLSVVGGLDGIVHCAGIVAPFPLKYLKEETLESVMKVNFSGPVLLTSRLLQAGKLSDGASVVFISSVSSQLPFNGSAAYSSSKAALEAYARSLAYEGKNRKIRSNAVRAGLVKTAMYETAKGFQALSAEEEYSRRYLLGFGQPLDVANLIVFLLSEKASWLNGAVIDLDGGYRLG